MLRRASLFAIITALFCAGTLPVAWSAGRYTQGKVRRLKACVGLIGTMGEPPTAAPPANPFPVNSPPDPDAVVPTRTPNPNPYLFYVLDQRKDLKPDGWEFSNPAALPNASAQQAQRWQNAGVPLTQGMPLRSDMAAYWEVLVNQANFDRLAQMDVIYIPIARPGPTMFTEEQRRVLTRLADAGVTIWVDWAVHGPTLNGFLGGNEMGPNPLGMRKNAFFTNVDMATRTGLAMSPGAGHPLLTGQLVFQPGDAVRIGKAYPAGTNPALTSQDRAIETRALDLQATTNFTAVVPLAGGVPPENGAYVAAGRYGAGYVVATAGNVSAALAGFIPPSALRAGNADLSLAETEDLKFAYNLFAWSTEVTNTQKNSRHTGQSGVALDGMIEQGNYPHLVQSGPGFATYPPPTAGVLPPNPASPIVVNGVVVAAVRSVLGGGTSELVALESNPNDDYDFNGFVDDPNNAMTPATGAMIDYSVGQNYDRIDRVPLGLGDIVYGLTVGELPDPGPGGAGSKSFIFAGANTGILSVPTPRPSPTPSFWGGTAQAATGLGMAVTGAPAFALLPGPVGTGFTQAKLYAGGIQQPTAFGSNNGKVVGLVVAPLNGAMQPEWYFPPRSEANRLGPVAGSMVTAQVQDNATGAVDTMVFATTVAPPLTAPGGGAGQPGEGAGGVRGWIVATRGDVLTFPTANTPGGGANPAAGRKFVSARWVNNPQGRQAPQNRELMWDPFKHFEVRVMDKSQNYVLARFTPVSNPGLRLLPDGTAGQVELPEPSMTNGLQMFSMDPSGADARLRNQWNLNDFVLLADYSVLPQPVDTGLTGEATIRPRFSPATPYVQTTVQQVEPTGIGGGVGVGRDNMVYYGTGKGYMCAVEWRKGQPNFRWKIKGVAADQRNGQHLDTELDPAASNFLQQYAFVGSPAAGNRIVFASRQGNAYVFEPDATIRFKLGGNIPWTVGLAQEVVLEADHGQNVNVTNPGVMATQAPFGRSIGQFTVDPENGSVTFLNMENFSLDMNVALSPGTLAAAPFNIDTGGRPAVPIRWWFRNAPAGLPNRMAPATAYVPLPLVATYSGATTGVPGEQFFSGPVLTSDKIFLQGTSGWLHELPLDPKSVDPNFPRIRDNGGMVVLGLQGFDLGNGTLYGAGAGLRRLKNVAAGTGTFSIASPAVTQGMVVTNSPRGLTLYSSPNVVVADSNRVVEASGNSTALAATDVVVKHRMDISEFPIPTDPGFANTEYPPGSGQFRPILTERVPISRAAVVKKLDRRSSLTTLFNSSSITAPPIDGTTGIKESPEWAESSYLVADAGNNRIVEFNPAGKVVWELHELFDPMGLIPVGEPLKLAQPMDVQRWVEREVHPAFPEPLYVIHTLIADTANNRVVEVVDKVQYLQGNYGPNSFVVAPGQVGADGQPFRWYHVVVWSSQTNAQGLKLRYRTAQKVFWPDANGNRIDVSMVPISGDPGGGQAIAAPPYLPRERALSYVMTTVQGQQVGYAGATTFNQYFRFFTTPSRAVLERKPTVNSGSDSILFLRGSFRVDEASGGAVAHVPSVRQDYAMTGIAVAADQYRYAQGIIDPNLPILTRINDEGGGGQALHNLNGVSSVQLTVRSDIKFSPQDYGAAPMLRVPYLLIADTDGVWETRLLPSGAGNRMVWGFTVEDYAYVTGAGNGNPALIYSTNPTDHRPGGRRFNAVCARRLPSGLVLISSRMPANEQPRGNFPGGEFTHLNIGADVFMLRPSDYRTFVERGGVPYNRIDVSTHGWQADQWIQNAPAPFFVPPAMRGAPSIRWRAAEQLNPNAAPTLRTQLEAGNNPAELTGSYIPVQPSYADIAY